MTDCPILEKIDNGGRPDKISSNENELKLSDRNSTESTADQIDSGHQEIQPEIPVADRNVSMSSENLRSTVKLEEPNAEEVQFKLRRKVCKKIRSILHEELGMKLKEAEEYTLAFEQSVYAAFNANIQDYIQAIKAVCNRVRVGANHPG